MSASRSRLTKVVAAGTLTLAAAISAAALPPTSSPVPASADAAYMTTVGQQGAAHPPPARADVPRQQGVSDRMRAIQSERAHEQQVAAARAMAAKAAARKAVAAKATARKAAEQAADARPAQEKPAQAKPAQRAADAGPSGSPKQVAERMLARFGWPTSQFSCLQPLWEQESGWSVTAENPTSGAYGIPQALPGSQMVSAGPDWQTDAVTQVSWGLTYIHGRYGSPCGAWAHEESSGWY
jgi:hypothetical protein